MITPRRLVLAGAALLGVATLRARAVPRWAAVAFAVSLPLGVGLDAATNLFPFGELFFFAGFGSLMRLGFAARGQPQIDSPIG